YDSDCQELESVTIPAGSVATLIADYRYVGIAPLLLSAGQTYRVAAVMRCDDFTPQFQSPTGFALDPSVTGVETRRIAGGSSLACPTETSTVLGFAPNFLIGPACGNGVVQDGEQCDDGGVADGDCCSSTCQYETGCSPCAADDQGCTDDVCNATGTCTHDPSPAGTECRPAPGECDAAESCDGSSPGCPPDAHKPNGTPCTDDGLFCSGTEACQNGSCTSGGDPCEVGICDETANRCVAPSSTPKSATSTPTPTASVTLTQTGTPTGSQSSTPTRTPAGPATPTFTASATVAASATAAATAATPAPITPSPSPTNTPAPIPCVGDCDGGSAVSINELIVGVNIALGTLSVDRCPAFDPSGDGNVAINELIAAVANALNGCPQLGT
ncbi:MAG: hypothetical protein ACREJT_06735, partial [Myxococcota bacterium]